MKGQYASQFTTVFKNNRAFTLLEVMIAVSIIAIALVALFGSQSRSLSQATEAHFNNIAPMLASLKLAELKSGIISLDNDEGSFDDDFSEYTWKIEISPAPLESFDNLSDLEVPLQQVTLTISWSETKYTYSLTHYALEF
ncbi:prepilin-type N-terminal cleavage/methylation domain-containing protein [Desulforhopalus sp. IMCC35007]|uniref:prepilin-type N-terminal cleavage/methylation domain-containing protein n=1 Tax=Desulforhopalus sp. IMCC35007 TaxID=2569543 RepID=UPI0010AE9359|nr:prepilin-type N-terminal cleavage/methylation domain-containing protein [Desulforhopalus sp. IMCC35007]TKB07302.1 prepilin-type N-terminal cleavage/methylation domain-containing protein [Desulforhopalus sp. IMCC35007]